MSCEILLTHGTKMEYSPHVALTSGEDSASALEGSTPVRAGKKELRAAPFSFSAIFAQPSVTCFDEMSNHVGSFEHRSHELEVPQTRAATRTENDVRGSLKKLSS